MNKNEDLSNIIGAKVVWEGDYNSIGIIIDYSNNIYTVAWLNWLSQVNWHCYCYYEIEDMIMLIDNYNERYSSSLKDII